MKRAAKSKSQIKSANRNKIRVKAQRTHHSHHEYSHRRTVMEAIHDLVVKHNFFFIPEVYFDVEDMDLGKKCITTRLESDRGLVGAIELSAANCYWPYWNELSSLTDNIFLTLPPSVPETEKKDRKLELLKLVAKVMGEKNIKTKIIQDEPNMWLTLHNAKRLTCENCSKKAKRAYKKIQARDEKKTKNPEYTSSEESELDSDDVNDSSESVKSSDEEIL